MRISNKATFLGSSTDSKNYSNFIKLLEELQLPSSEEHYGMMYAYIEDAMWKTNDWRRALIDMKLASKEIKRRRQLENAYHKAFKEFYDGLLKHAQLRGSKV